MTVNLEQLANIFSELSELSLEDKVDAINGIRSMLAAHSPFNREPVDCVLWKKAAEVHSNDYNPNKVANTEMDLLKLSVLADGYTQPIVTWDDKSGQYEVVDGFHRSRVGREVGAISKRLHGYLPIVAINGERSGKEDRMASTIRHNRARGKHTVDAMAEIVLDLTKRNWGAEKIAKELGMDADEVLRLKQVSGLAELFSDREFSKAWDIE